MSRISFPVPSAASVSTAILPAVAPSGFAMLAFPRAAVAFGPSFTPCAGGFSVGDAWTHLYQLAYQQAQAALEPSRFQKALAPCWN